MLFNCYKFIIDLHIIHRIINNLGSKLEILPAFAENSLLVVCNWVLYLDIVCLNIIYNLIISLMKRLKVSYLELTLKTQKIYISGSNL